MKVRELLGTDEVLCNCSEHPKQPCGLGRDDQGHVKEVSRQKPELTF